MTREKLIVKVAEALLVKDDTAAGEQDFLVNFVTDQIWWDRIAKVAVDVISQEVEIPSD